MTDVPNDLAAMTQEQLLTEHWNAKQALEYWKEREKQVRYAFADKLCAGEPEYKNTTLDLAGGYKLKLSVKRSVKVDTSSEQWKTFTALMINKEDSGERLNAFCKIRQRTEFNLSGYNALTDGEKEHLGACVSLSSDVSIAYEQQAENR